MIRLYSFLHGFYFFLLSGRTPVAFTEAVESVSSAADIKTRCLCLLELVLMRLAENDDTLEVLKCFFEICVRQS